MISTMYGTGEQRAITVNLAYKRYGKDSVILRGLNMTVNKGTIYDLLGPSGCGKTTLLSCIVGRQRLDSGSICTAFPNKKQIGYMPQEITLSGDLRIDETLNFYGTIYGMPADQIRLRTKELLTFLDLPPLERRIKNCSGGQQRRVSLAVTLLHEPDLLILDEPTVGVDPVLCAKIWECFFHMVYENNKTIIITTHYIQEAKNANTVGLMRGGILLAEESPLKLLERFNCESLEDVFFKLSEKQEYDHIVQELPYPKIIKSSSPIKEDRRFRKHRFKAQLVKNYLWTLRNLAVTLFVCFVPAVCVFIVCTMDIDNIITTPIAVVISAYLNCTKSLKSLEMTIMETSCNTENEFACYFLETLNKKYPVTIVLYHSRLVAVLPRYHLVQSETHSVKSGPFLFRQINNYFLQIHCLDSKEVYTDLSEARQKVLAGQRSAIVYLPDNYTLGLMERLEKQAFASEWAIDHGTVLVWADLSSLIVSYRILEVIYQNLVKLLEEVCLKCKIDIRFSRIPLAFQEPIYGSTDMKYVTYLLPGIICPFVFFMTFMFSSAAMMMEKVSGQLERSQIAGLNLLEMIAAHVIIQFLVMCVQNIILLILLYLVFDNVMNGSYFLMVILINFCEFFGMMFGVLISMIMEKEMTVSVIGISSVLTTFMLCGAVWPMEGQYWMLKYFSKLIPLSYSVQSYFNISIRGWDFSKTYPGFLSSSAGAAILATICYMIYRMKIVHI